MASIRKRGGSYLLVVSMGYTPNGRRRNPQQKTVRPPAGLTPKQTEKWLQEQAMLFEMSCKKMNPDIDRSITLEKYTEIWLQTIAPDKLAKSTLVREKQDIERFKPYLGSYKLVDLRPEHFRSLYAKLRKQKNKATGKPLSEATVEGVHSCLCGILSDAMEGGYLNHNPAWRTYKYAGQKKEKNSSTCGAPATGFSRVVYCLPSSYCAADALNAKTKPASASQIFFMIYSLRLIHRC